MTDPKVVRKADFLTVENCNREVDRQRGFVAQLHARAQELEDGYGKCIVNRAELQIEITRLREALESIAVNAKDEFSSVTATAALKEKP